MEEDAPATGAPPGEAGPAPDDLALVRSSGFFDAEWYAVAQGLPPETDPAAHYLTDGEGSAPSPWFDGAAYLAVNTDVAAAGMHPLLHFLRYGHLDGRLPPPLAGASRPEPERRETGLTHLGPVIAARVAAARALDPGAAAALDYAAIRDDFDLTYYLVRYPDVAADAAVDPVRHYLDHGAAEGRDPSPRFATQRYLQRYPHVARTGLNPFRHWLEIGRRLGYVAERYASFEALCGVVGIAPAEAAARIGARHDDLRARLARGTLGAMVAKAARLEPLVALSWPAALEVKQPPFLGRGPIDATVAMHALQAAAGFRRARVVIAVNRPRWGAGRRMEGHLAHALASGVAADEIVVISTEAGGAAPFGRFPDGVRQVDFAAPAVRLEAEARERLFVEFVRSLHPEAAINVNSRLFWDAMRPFGRALAAATSLHAGLFCTEETALGFRTGYPLRYVYRYFDLLDGLYTDSHALAAEIAAQYGLPDVGRAKLVVLEAPVDPGIPVAALPEPRADGRRQVFWAGRFDAQKRVDLALALAARMPDADFRLWGEAVLGPAAGGVPDLPANVTLEGVYAAFADLPLHEADAWLYTAAWDGVPSQLLEVAMTGVPIVGGRVGGTAEILEDAIAPFDDLDAFEARLRAVLADPAAARAEALERRARHAARRTPAAYAAALARRLPKGMLA